MAWAGQFNPARAAAKRWSCAANWATPPPASSETSIGVPGGGASKELVAACRNRSGRVHERCVVRAKVRVQVAPPVRPFVTTGQHAVSSDDAEHIRIVEGQLQRPGATHR